MGAVATEAVGRANIAQLRGRPMITAKITAEAIPRQCVAALQSGIFMARTASGDNLAPKDITPIFLGVPRVFRMAIRTRR